MQRLTFIIAFLFCSLNINAQNFDIDLLRSINKKETVAKDKYLELCASSITTVNIGAPTGMLLAGLIKHDKRLQQNALFMAGAYFASGMMVQGAKKFFNRNRPFEDYSFIIKRDDESGGRAFPSGHTSAAFCTATSLSLYCPKWYVILPSYLYATSVGWARMYQGVHYPSDVLAGAIIGAGSAWVGYKVQRWHNNKVSYKHAVLHQKIGL